MADDLADVIARVRRNFNRANVKAVWLEVPALFDRIEALEKAVRDAQSGLRYIQQRYGALEGVGWDRVLPSKGDK